MKKNIILIGFMGSGKTSIGVRLAKSLDYSFLDTDTTIVEKADCSISAIFDAMGEAGFRQMETELLKELNTNLESTVISTGGGMPIREENRLLLRSLGHVIFLNATNEVLQKRMEGDTKRPLLAVENKEQKIADLLKIRVPMYQACAHTIVDTSDKSIYEIINEIMLIIKNISGEHEIKRV